MSLPSGLLEVRARGQFFFSVKTPPQTVPCASAGTTERPAVHEQRLGYAARVGGMEIFSFLRPSSLRPAPCGASALAV